MHLTTYPFRAFGGSRLLRFGGPPFNRRSNRDLEKLKDRIQRGKGDEESVRSKVSKSNLIVGRTVTHASKFKSVGAADLEAGIVESSFPYPVKPHRTARRIIKYRQRDSLIRLISAIHREINRGIL
jgi:hypothetical protein